MQFEQPHLVSLGGKDGQGDLEAAQSHSLPKHVVIVGGSLAGLMHGIQLKRHGSRVTILEKDPQAERRQAQAAGIGFGANMNEFLGRYDITGGQVSLPLWQSRFSFGTHVWDWARLPVRRNLTSWGLLHRVLRANLAAAGERAGAGSVTYCAGKCVDGLEYPDKDGGATVFFTDVETGVRDSISADFVIGADGIHSTIQRLVRAPVRREYAGYVVWRGAVPESGVSSETARFFSEGVAADLLWKSYMICYIIPTDDGCFDQGNRIINWLWYHNFNEDSPELIEILTDVEGQQHQLTVPAGRVKPEVWARHRDISIPYMAEPYAELLRAANSPFVTKVCDTLSEQGTFCDNHVILAGDAYAATRPHLAVATDHAAWQCLSLLDLWTGRLSWAEWHRQLQSQSTRLWFRSRLLGFWGQGLWLSFFRTALAYLRFLVKQRLTCIWRWSSGHQLGRVACQ